MVSQACSAAEALDRQEPFVNPTLANHALALLARLFRYGTVSYHGGFVGLTSLASAQALRVDPKYWQRLRRKAGCREVSKRNLAALEKLRLWGIRADTPQREQQIGPFGLIF